MELKEYEKTLDKLESEISKIENPNSKSYLRLSEEIGRLKKEVYSNLTPWDRVTIARDSKRPRAQDYLELIFDSFYEFHGDRRYGDDPSIIGGIAEYKGLAVTVIAQSKGKSLEENLKKNFGMASPEGYRKALRLAKQAEKFKRPIITFVDTPGAFPGKGAEERGQAEAIANCLYEFSTLKVPIICVVLSEGGSGGALALSVADRIGMLENAVYSILSPEGFASILWKDERRAKEASEYMKLTSYDLKEKKIVDEIIEEPLGGAHRDLKLVSSRIQTYIDNCLEELMRKKTVVLLNERYDKFPKNWSAKLKGIEILGCGYAKGEHSITNEDLGKIVDTNDEWIITRTGISSRYVSEHKNTSDLALEASLNAIADGKISKDSISLIIVATLTPDKFTPSTASILQEKLGLNQPLVAFDVNAACSGYVYALQIASSLLKDGETGLVVGAETLSKIVDYSDRNTCVLFGDGAGASIIKNTGSEKEIEFFTRSVPDVEHVLYADGITLNSPLQNGEKNYGYLHMNGKEVFKFAIGVMMESIETILREVNKTIEDIDLIIPHQANVRIINHVARKLGVDSSKFYINLGEYGNTSAASIGIALACAKAEGKLRDGMKVVLVGFGAGLTYGASYIEI